MEERRHIPLTIEQIEAAERGELILETRNGHKVVQLCWMRPPYSQDSGNVLHVVTDEGCTIYGYIDGSYTVNGANSHCDLFVSTDQSTAKPKPLYEVGEIIEVSKDGIKWFDAEYISTSRGFIIAWYEYIPYAYSRHRKKQIEKTVTIEGKSMTVKEALKFLTNL